MPRILNVHLGEAQNAIPMKSMLSSAEYIGQCRIASKGAASRLAIMQPGVCFL